MTKNYFLELAEYNIWANNRVCHWANEIAEEQWTKPVVNSFNSIQETVLHIMGAENIWYERLVGKPQPVWLPKQFKGSKAEHIEKWKTISQQLKNFIADFDENKLSENFAVTKLNGEKSTIKYYLLFAHIFNHSAYHRGQLVTMFRQVGYEKISSVDLYNFYGRQM